MASPQQRVRARVHLVAVNGTTDLWLDLCAFLMTLGMTRVRGRIVLCEKVGNFRVRPGIQTYETDPEVPDAPGPLTGSGVVGTSYLTTVSKVFVDFDPTLANNGVVNTKAGYRLGLLFSSTDSSVSRGEVILELWSDG